jgi:hypothetical protein
MRGCIILDLLEKLGVYRPPKSHGSALVGCVVVGAKT